MGLATASAAGAADRFAVATGGSDTAGSTCTEAQPCTLRRALLEASSGDVVTAAPGRYPPRAVVNPGITLRGTPGAAAPVIAANDVDHGSQADPAVQVDSGTLRGVDVEVEQRFNNSIARATGVAASGGSVVERVRVTGTRTGPGQLVGLELVGGALVRDSAVRVSTTTDGATGALVGDATLVGVTIVSDGVGVTASPCFELHGGNSTATLINVIARGGADTGETDLAASPSAPCTTIGGAPNQTGTITASHSAFRPDRSTGPVVAGDGNVSAAPQLDAALAQTAGSPTVDAGIADTRAGGTDLTGGPRVEGAAVDIGADELAAAAPAPAGPPSMTALPVTTPAPPVAGAPDRTAPKVTSAALAATTVRRGRSTTLRLRLDGPASIVVRLERERTGRRAGGRCSATARRGARCTLGTLVRTLRATGATGESRVAIATRFSGRTLAVGRYRLVIVATDAAGNRSAARTVRLRVRA